MKKIETVITRDNSLIDVMAWHEGYTSGMKEWLGWSYSETIFYIHNGYTEVMRPPEEHLVEFKKVVLEKIDSDPAWFGTKVADFNILIDAIYSFYTASKVKIAGEVDNKELALMYETYREEVRKVIGPFITTIWLPMWSETDSAILEKYKKELEVSIECRKKAEYIFPKGAELTNEILRMVSKQLKIEESLIRVISADELLNYLQTGTKPDVNVLRKRYEGVLYSKKGIMITDNSDADLTKSIAEIGYEYVPKKKIETKEIKGQSACKGKIQGKVRVIMSKKDIHLLQDGEVLVTAMTTPEYLPAMQKSCAFVTDEGGITCHAAIVAREMNKPCIIGTKIGTQILKEGQLVEVDADKGVVTILK